ncbi:MAG: phage tail protein [Eubacteriales bacterium]|nr:phage tail protein [Eubacteriales bacterium]
MPEAVVKKAVSTIGTVLKAGADAASLAKLTRIKSYPDLGGAPEQLESTDLEDPSQTFEDGVQQQDTMEFTANYTKAEYDKVAASAGKQQKYQLEFGENGEDGIFSWEGKHSVRVTGGEVNAIREMVITITPSTKIDNKAVAA